MHVAKLECLVRLIGRNELELRKGGSVTAVIADVEVRGVCCVADPAQADPIPLRDQDQIGDYIGSFEATRAGVGSYGTCVESSLELYADIDQLEGVGEDLEEEEEEEGAGQAEAEAPASAAVGVGGAIDGSPDASRAAPAAPALPESSGGGSASSSTPAGIAASFFVGVRGATLTRLSVPRLQMMRAHPLRPLPPRPLPLRPLSPRRPMFRLQRLPHQPLRRLLGLGLRSSEGAAHLRSRLGRHGRLTKSARRRLARTTGSSQTARPCPRL